VPTMHGTSVASLGRIEDAQVLSLKYQAWTLDLVLVVPDAIDGLAAIERRLDADALAAIAAAPAQQGLVTVALPRFRFDTGIFSLREPLNGLGIRRAFSPQADFTGITGTAPVDGFWIADVVHRAFVDIDEHGTEAAAATAVAMVGAGLPPKQIGTVVCDRPFLALIRHVQTGTILFMIRVADPRG
jgi:serpin B